MKTKLSKRSIFSLSVIALVIVLVIANKTFGIGSNPSPPKLEIQRAGVILTITSADDREFDVNLVNLNHTLNPDCNFVTQKGSKEKYERSIIGEISLPAKSDIDYNKSSPPPPLHMKMGDSFFIAALGCGRVVRVSVDTSLGWAEYEF